MTAFRSLFLAVNSQKAEFEMIYLFAALQPLFTIWKEASIQDSHSEGPPHPCTQLVRGLKITSKVEDFPKAMLDY